MLHDALLDVPSRLSATHSYVPLGTGRLAQLCWVWLMLSETILSKSHLFRYAFCTLTIVTAVLLQDMWFPERLLKRLGCPGQFCPCLDSAEIVFTVLGMLS